MTRSPWFSSGPRARFADRVQRAANDPNAAAPIVKNVRLVLLLVFMLSNPSVGCEEHICQYEYDSDSHPSQGPFR